MDFLIIALVIILFDSTGYIFLKISVSDYKHQGSRLSGTFFALDVSNMARMSRSASSSFFFLASDFETRAGCWLLIADFVLTQSTS